MGRRYTGGLATGLAVGVAMSMVLALGASACATQSPLRPALDELSSVGGPDDRGPFDVDVVDCSDHAEMPAGYASYRHAGLRPTGSGREEVDAFNAEVEAVTAWYVPRWEALGWKVNAHGEVFKEIDGTRMRGFIDVGKGDGYAIVVVEAAGRPCG